MSNFTDVQEFHEKFGLADQRPLEPCFPDGELLEFRTKFMREELNEFVLACDAKDLAGAADALVDLVYVVMGTADLMGLPWEALWAEVQRANMTKQRALRKEDSTRGSLHDVIKPPGWTKPRIEHILGLMLPHGHEYRALLGEMSNTEYYRLQHQCEHATGDRFPPKQPRPR